MAEIIPFSTCWTKNSPNFFSFKQQVQQSGGTIYEIMHGFYEDPASKIGKSLTYDSDLQSLLEGAFRRRTPAIFFEQSKDRKVHTLEDNLNLFDRTVYFETTKNGDPDLVGKRSWGNHINTLKASGVKHIIVAGQYLLFQELENILADNPSPEVNFYISRAWKTLVENDSHTAEWLKKVDGAVPILCAGTLIRRLVTAGFDVSLSPALSPNIRIRTRFRSQSSTN